AKAIDRKPLDPQAWYCRGYVHVRLKRYAEAVADFSKCLELKADHFDALHLRGHAQEGLQRWKESAADHSRAIELAPENLQLRICRGRAYAQFDEWKKAAEDLAVGSMSPGADARVSYEYALVRLQLGEKAGYQKACAQLLERYGKTAGPGSA